MRHLIVLLFISALVINQAEKAKANQHYSYNVKDDHKEDHPQQRQVTDLEYNENNQANQKAVAQEDIDSFRLYEGIQPHLPPHHQIQPPPPHLETQQQNPQNKFTSVHYNVRQNLDDTGDVDIVYHHARDLEGDHEASQQEKPSLLALLKSQQQELSEGYATFLQEEQHESSNDNYQPPRKEEAEEKQQQPERQLTNPQLLHYKKLQEQQQLYYQQLQQEEQQQQQQAHLLLQKPSQEIQQQLPQKPQPQPSHQILYHQQQQQQLPPPPHAPTYVTPQTTLSPPQRLSPSAPPAIVHPNLHHQLQQHQHQQQHQLPAIVSHATGNEASPSSPINPQPYHRNRLPHYARDTGVKYATHHKAAYGHPLPARQPATVYGPPPHLPALGSIKHSKQVIYAPMRFVYDRKLPYSSKTFPYPPSFISLTTTTEKPAHNYYSYDQKSAYNKIPDLFGHRKAKSLLDSYIPSWQVVKMLQQYHQQTSNAQQPSANLQTLAMPYHRNYKRNAKDQEKP